MGSYTFCGMMKKKDEKRQKKNKKMLDGKGRGW